MLQANGLNRHPSTTRCIPVRNGLTNSARPLALLEQINLRRGDVDAIQRTRGGAEATRRGREVTQVRHIETVPYTYHRGDARAENTKQLASEIRSIAGCRARRAGYGVQRQAIRWTLPNTRPIWFARMLGGAMDFTRILARGQRGNRLSIDAGQAAGA